MSAQQAWDEDNFVTAVQQKVSECAHCVSTFGESAPRSRHAMASRPGLPFCLDTMCSATMHPAGGRERAHSVCRRHSGDLASLHAAPPAGSCDHGGVQTAFPEENAATDRAILSDPAFSAQTRAAVEF